MSKLMRPLFHSDSILNQNKAFTYKGESYKVDFNLIKRNCKYFYERRSEYKYKQTIEIKESVNISAETFQTFLNCSQNQPTYIDDILGVNYLSIKYQNEKLRQFTQDFITKYYDQLIFESILFKSQIEESNEYYNENKNNDDDDNNNNKDTSKEEETLSNHFNEYIEDERIFKLPINILERIFKNYIKMNKNIFEDEKEKKKINQFLIRSLKEYKKAASILFLNITFDKFDRELIISLHNDFSDIFDFNMINSKSLFDTTYEMLGEISNIQLLMKDICEQRRLEKKELNKYKMNIEEKLKEIRHDYQTKLEQNQTEISTKLQILENNQNKLTEQELKEIHNEQNKINEYQTKLEQNQTEFSTKLQTLENNQNDSSNRIQTLESNQNNSSNRIQTLENNQNNSSNRIRTLENKQSTIENQISKFATREISTQI